MAVLAALGILDTDFDRELDALTRLAGELTDSPIALISLVDQNRLWFKAKLGLAVREMPREHSFCGQTIRQDTLLEVSDARGDPRFRHNSLASGEPAVCFYAGQSLVIQGQPVGTLCVMDRQPRTLNNRQRDALAKLAEIVVMSVTRSAALTGANRTEAALRKLMNQVPGVILQCKMKPDGRFSFPYWSGSARRATLVTAEQVSADPRSVMNLVHPADLARVMDELRRSAQTLEIWQCEFRVMARDGTISWREIHATPERSADGSVLWHASLNDTTPRKIAELALRESEQRVALAMRASQLGMVVWSVDPDQVGLDAFAASMHGLDAAPRTLSWTDWLQMIHPDDRDRVAAGLSECGHLGRALVLEFRLLRIGGALRTLEVYVDAQSNEEPTARCLVGACRDMTGQIDARRLELEKQAAERTAQTKGDLLSRVSHEFRTPLNAILGFSELLRLSASHSLGAEQQAQLGHIESAGQHLLSLVNDILDLSRSDVGSGALRTEPVALGAVLQECVTMLAPLAKTANVSVHVEAIQSNAVRFDRRDLIQVLLNLLTNAIKYNRSGGEVTVKTWLDCDLQWISVIDTGPGMTQQQIGHLFEPFNRLGAQNSAVPGSGLGLAIAKQLVERMHGRIEVSSVVGGGSEFRVALPADCVPGHQPERASIEQGYLARTRRIDDTAPLIRETPERPSVGSLTDPLVVLYVEDNGLNRALMHSLFAMHPTWRLETSEDGASALESVRDIAPKLILLDIHLPDCTGVELLGRLRVIPGLEATPIVAVSADATPEEVERALAGGFLEYWTKPLHVQRTAAAIARLLDRAAITGRVWSRTKSSDPADYRGSGASPESETQSDGQS